MGNYINQRGMNCAIGGLGQKGIGEKRLSNDGSCGHFYSMFKKAEAGYHGAMLMGLESDASGMVNQMAQITLSTTIFFPYFICSLSSQT